MSSIIDNSSLFWNSNLDDMTKNFCQCVETPHNMLEEEQQINNLNNVSLQRHDKRDSEKRSSVNSEFLSRRKQLFSVRRDNMPEKPSILETVRKSDLYIIEEKETRKLKIRGTWTKEEDKILLFLRNDQKVKDWNIISERIGTKGRRQCYIRYNKLMDIRDRVPWKREEEIKLQELVEKIGPNFEEISNFITNHTIADMEKRYYKKLNPNRIFSDEEDKIILSYFQENRNPCIDDLVKLLNHKSRSDVKKRILKILPKESLDKAHEECKSLSQNQSSSISSNRFSSSSDLSNRSGSINTEGEKEIFQRSDKLEEEKKQNGENIEESILGDSLKNNFSDFFGEEFHIGNYLKDLDLDNNNSMHIDSEFNSQDMFNNNDNSFFNNPDENNEDSFQLNFLNVFTSMDSGFHSDSLFSEEDEIDRELLLNPEIVSLVDKKKSLEEILGKISSISEKIIDNVDFNDFNKTRNSNIQKIGKLLISLKNKQSTLKSQFKEKAKVKLKSLEEIRSYLVSKIDLLMVIIKVTKLKVFLLNRLISEHNVT